MNDKSKMVYHSTLENANTSGEYRGETGAQFQLKGTDENGIEVYETSDKMKKMKYSERKALLLNLMKNEFAGRTAKFEKKGQVYYALYDEAGVRKGVYGDKKSDKKGFNAKVNIGADGNYIELAENAEYDKTSSEQQGKKNKFHRDAKEWDYYVKTIKSDGIYFDVVINVKDNGNEQYVYDVQLNEKEVALSHALKHLKSKEATSNSIVSKDLKKSSEIVKKSLKIEVDSDGRKLSEEQMNYFAESKVLTEDNKLKVMYHGSPEQFTIFDRKKAKSSGHYGRGFYFSESESHAGQYGSKYEVYP